MSLVRSLWSVVLSAAFVVGWTGCNSATPQKTPKAPAPEGKPAATTSGGATSAHASQPATAAGSAAAKAASPEGLAGLSAEDRALAEKQRICPVSGEPLGSMGKPYKITVKGQTVFLCCDGCEAEIKKDPDKYLQKISAAR